MKFSRTIFSSSDNKYASERSGMVWDMGCRYYIMGEYDIKIILFDFYEII